MNTDCTELSTPAQEIFAKLKPYYPLGPFKEGQWIAEGKIYDNGWYDLRKSLDRQRLMEQKKNFIGYLVELEASRYWKKNGSLSDFTAHHFTRHMQETAELLMLLTDLDFQIETLDFTGPLV